MPAILSGRADAMLGGFLNVEGVDLRLRGKKPTVIPVDRLGIPTYNELVVVANSDRLGDETQNVRLFIAALQRGTQGGRRRPARGDQGHARRRQGPEPQVHRRRGAKDAPPVAEAGDKPYGYMDPKQWQRFAQFFADHGVIKAVPSTGDVLTNDLLPGKIPN